MTTESTPMPELLERFNLAPRSLSLPLKLDMPLPPRCLSLNARPSRWEKIKATKQSRDCWHFGVLSQVLPGRQVITDAVVVDMMIYTTTGRTIDRQNIIGWFKAGFDGITDSQRVWKDDKQVSFGTINQMKCGSYGTERVELTIQLAEETK